MIKNFGLSDTISLLGFGAVTSISLDAGTKILTVTNGLGASKTVHFDVTYAYAGNNFMATVDGNGNTYLKIANLLTDSDFKMVDLSDTGPGVTVNHTIGNTTNGVLTGWTGTGHSVVSLRPLPLPRASPAAMSATSTWEAAYRRRSAETSTATISSSTSEAGSTSATVPP